MEGLINCKDRDDTVFIVHSHPKGSRGLSKEDKKRSELGYGDPERPNSPKVKFGSQVMMGTPISAGWGMSPVPEIHEAGKPKKPELNSRAPYGEDSIMMHLAVGKKIVGPWLIMSQR